jgi:hypothetical protein
VSAFPSASSTGPVAGTSFTTVTTTGPGSSGSGWAYDGTAQQVNVTGNVNGLFSAWPLVLTNQASVTVSNCILSVYGGEGFTYAVTLAGTTTGTTISNCTIGGANATYGRIAYAVDCGVDPALTVQRCNISNFRVGVAIVSGSLISNYIHDPGFLGGDHTDGVSNLGTSGGSLLIQYNTILIGTYQTSPLDIGSTQSLCSHITVDCNLLAGGGYAFCGGASGAYASSSGEYFAFTNNAISTMYYADGGLFGVVDVFNGPETDPTNTWAGNTWYDGQYAGTAITAP